MDDRYRPRFHFTPPSDWMNDPNGLVYFEGEYHLFYQYRTPRDWGHAVSTDLVHWSHLPIALSHDDLGAIYSGSAVVDRDDTSGFFDGQPGMVAIFTHHNTREAPAGPQVQSIAYSRDRGRTWTMYAHNPVIANPGVADFRDPKVFWHAPTGRWVMVLTFNGDRVRFYTSTDLKEWAYANEFGVDQGARGGVWECPDLFELPIDGEGGTRWVLHVSQLYRDRTQTGHRPDMQYFVGDFDGTTFTNDNPADTVLWSDYGRDNYAAVSWSDLPPSDGRRILIGWMNNWAYAHQVPTSPWQGAMTVPREVRLRRRDGEVRLAQLPIVELQQLRGRAVHLEGREIMPAGALRVAGVGEAIELWVVLEPDGATECGIRLRTSPEQFTTIAYDTRESVLFVDRTHSGQTAFSPAFSNPRRAPLTPVQGSVELHILVDRCSLEVFANGGDVAVTGLIFPDDAHGNLAVEAYAVGGVARLRTLDSWELKDAGRGATEP